MAATCLDNGAGRAGELPPAGTVFRQPLRAEIEKQCASTSDARPLALPVRRCTAYARALALERQSLSLSFNLSLLAI